MGREEIINQIKSLKHGGANPQTDWVAKNRALLLSQIKNTLPEKAEINRAEQMWAGLSIFIPKPLVYNFVRPMAVILIVTIVATTTYSGTVKAASETLPGDWLYPAKRGIEKTQAAVLSVIGNATSQTQLHVEFAERRAEETKQIIKSNDPEKIAKVGETVAGLNSEMQSISTNLEATNTVEGSLQATVAKDIKQTSERIRIVLQDAKDDLALSPNVDNKALSAQISETKDLVKDVSVKAAEVLVAKNIEGDTSVSKEDVKKEINSALQKSVDDVGVSKQNIDGAKIILQTVKDAVQDLSDQAKKQNDPDLVSSTKQFNQQISTATNQTVSAVLKTEAATAAVDKQVTDAQTFLNNDDLTQAVGKVKEASQASKDIEKVSDTTIANTQTILPMVQVIKGNVVTASSTIAGAVVPVLIVSTTPASTASATPMIVPILLPITVSSSIKNQN